jgi:protein SCO1
MKAILASISLVALTLLLQAPVAAAEPIHFSLIDTNGKQVSDKDFAGSYLLVFFGYMHCPDICPTTLAEMAALQQALPTEMARKLSLAFVTGDPQRDTPAALKEFIGYFDDRILGFSGSTRAVDDLAWSLKAVVIRHGNGSGNYTVDHSTNYILLHDGEILDQIPNTLETDALIARIGKHL